MNFVHFDELEITHTESPIIQADDFYPFGMNMSSSWNRVGNVANKFLYNQGSEKEDETNWYYTPFRRYDATIGRFNGIDAMADQMSSITPYQYSYSNPISFSDPTGLMPGGGDEPDGGPPAPPEGYLSGAYGGNSSDYNFGTQGRISQGSGQHWLDHIPPVVNRSGGTVYILDPTGREWVPAQEILLFNSPNQNQEYVQAARNALRQQFIGPTSGDEFEQTDDQGLLADIVDATGDTWENAKNARQTYLKIDGSSKGTIDGVFNIILRAQD